MSYAVPVIVILLLAVLLFYLISDDTESTLEIREYVLKSIEESHETNSQLNIPVLFENCFKYYLHKGSVDEAIQITSKIPGEIFKLMTENAQLVDFISPEMSDLLFYTKVCSDNEQLKNILISDEIMVSSQSNISDESKNPMKPLFYLALVCTLIATSFFWFLVKAQSDPIIMSTRENFLLYSFTVLYLLPALLWIWYVIKKSRANEEG